MKHKKFIPSECKFCCKAWEKGCNGVWNYAGCDFYQDETERIEKKKAEQQALIEKSRKRFNG